MNTKEFHLHIQFLHIKMIKEANGQAAKQLAKIQNIIHHHHQITCLRPVIHN
jgi:hypothetical protein